MKNILFQNDKIKSSLINRLKINRKSIQLLEPIDFTQKNPKYKLNTSRNNYLNQVSLDNKNQFKSNIFSTQNTDFNSLKKNLLFNEKKNDTSIKAFKNKKGNKKIKILSLLSKETPYKIKKKNNKMKLPLSLKKKLKSNNRRLTLDTDENSDYMTLSPTSNRNCTINIKKYNEIFNTVSSRLKSHFNKAKFKQNTSSILGTRNFSSKDLSYKHVFHSPNKRRSSLKMSHNIKLTKSSGKKVNITMDDYKKILNKEFNYKELINIENNRIKEKLKNFKTPVYDKFPLFNTTEKLNLFLGREFNLDLTNLKKSFDKKYKVYTNSINKIKEINHKNLFSNNNVFGFKISLENNDKNNDSDDIYGYKTQFSNRDAKDALHRFYSHKVKDFLNKKLELQKELIELKNKFSYIIEQEKSEKNRLGINYGEINQIVEKKFIYKEIYELDILQKKKRFFDEQTKILYQTKDYLPNKVLKENLKQKTINKFKDITGVHFT